MSMKAVIPNENQQPPCIVYWTGRRRRSISVGVITWCNADRDASAGVLQVPDGVPCCESCETAVKELTFPKQRG